LNDSPQSPTSSCKIVAPSCRQALRLVREKLGPDAIILTSRVASDGIEIVATLEEPAAVTPVAAHTPVNEGDIVLKEIHSMRGMLEEQLSGIAWNDKQRGDPVRRHLLRTLLGTGLSARLAKDLLQNLPAGQSHAAGLDHAKAELARKMPVLENEDALLDEGGVFALMGPTGVGKTTTTAKLAARCVMRFGSDKLALVTTDSYRIGAYEQLRIYGQILGVSVYAVKDAADLERVLAELRHKHMVLIDTVGMSQRDRAVSEQIAMLCSASRPVKRLLLLNASCHGDTLNEVVQAYRHSEQKAGTMDLAGCIFTKMDEATHPAVLLDTAIRHQLRVHYISSGQMVPEHLTLVDREALVDSVFEANSTSAWFVPGEADVDERPESFGNAAELAAAEAVSERLRMQCQQLIRALTDDAQELATSANTLASGHIGFDETRALWRQLGDATVGADAVRQILNAHAVAESQLNCTDCVLVVAGETSLATPARMLASSMLLSDRTGLPFAALHQLVGEVGQAAEEAEVPGMSAQGDWQQQDRFGKPLVHLFANIPAAGLISQWQASGLQWAALATASLQIEPVAMGAPDTLARLCAGLAFASPVAAMYRGKKSWISVADVYVSLRADPYDCSGNQATSTVLRCVVRRILDAGTGQVLAHNYVLASGNLNATAQKIAQWPEWRTAAEPYFKLLKHGILQIGSKATDETGTARRLLIAGQASITVFRLSCVQAVWADDIRNVLARLVGRAMRADRPVPGPVLLEGLLKLFVLLDALEPEGPTQSPDRGPVLVKV
jgi:flagellar biosynthesis protein FlhF